MARLHGEILVEAVTRRWFEAYVRALLARAEGLRLDDDGWILNDEDLIDVTLVEGRHLTAGARYQHHIDPAEGTAGQGTTSELVLTSWERHALIGATIITWHPEDDRTTWTVELRKPTALESVAVGGAHHARKRLRRLSWSLRLDCARWWRLAQGRAAPRRRNAPVVALVRHPLGQGRLWAGALAAEGGKWRVVVTVAVRGRGWVRPLAAIGLLFARGTIEAKFREMLAEIAEDWNKDIPELRESDPSEAGLWVPRLQADRSELDRWIEENS